jgi:hypothetical protein
MDVVVDTPCFTDPAVYAGASRPSTHPLPLGPTTIATINDNSKYTGSFTFNDYVSEEVEAMICPGNGMLTAGRNALGVAAIKLFAKMSPKQQVAALRAAAAQIPDLLPGTDLGALWDEFDGIDRKIILLYLTEERPMHTIMQINYTLTPTGNTRKEELPFSRQTCSWSLCWQRAALAGIQCRLYDMYSTQNSTYAAVWAQVIEQTFKQQVSGQRAGSGLLCMRCHWCRQTLSMPALRNLLRLLVQCLMHGILVHLQASHMMQAAACTVTQPTNHWHSLRHQLTFPIHTHTLSSRAHLRAAHPKSCQLKQLPPSPSGPHPHLLPVLCHRRGLLVRVAQRQRLRHLCRHCHDWQQHPGGPVGDHPRWDAAAAEAGLRAGGRLLGCVQQPCLRRDTSLQCAALYSAAGKSDG